ncbi:hypothetical protein KY285_013290 [Solanum tuberosum]|nr:hypothetical protein KY285_013290 [Solanum tuberosum]
MATTSGQPPPETGQTLADPALTRNYAANLRPSLVDTKPVTMRPISYLHGEPRIVWDEEEVTQMIYKENLQYAVIGKFSYGMPEIKELRKIIPKQCELKGECIIGLLGTRHVLIRTEIMEDYVKFLSKPAFYLT